MPPFINAPPLKAPPPSKASPPAASAPAGASSSHQGPAPLSDPAESAQQATAAASTHRQWMCPACTLFRTNTHGRCIVGSAPYTPGSPAGTEHIRSRKHIRAMRHVQSSLFQPRSMAEYFSHIPEEPMPSFDRTTPSQAFRAYVARCGGDPVMTMAHFDVSPP